MNIQFFSFIFQPIYKIDCIVKTYDLTLGNGGYIYYFCTIHATYTNVYKYCTRAIFLFCKKAFVCEENHVFYRLNYNFRKIIRNKTDPLV